MENLNNLEKWEQMAADLSIVGPRFSSRDMVWYVDLRSVLRANSFKTNSLELPAGFLNQVEIPMDVVAKLPTLITCLSIDTQETL